MTEEERPAEDRPEDDGREEDMRQDENKNGRTEKAPDGAGSADQAAPAQGSPAAAASTEEILPSKAAEDDARSWGDRENDHDTWLKEQKPPHWG